jgi:hypothetical protein
MDESVALLAAVFTILAVIVSAVWAVATIKTTTRVLTEKISHLTDTIGRLESVLSDYGTKIARADTRLTRLETKAGMGHVHEG